ncbi:DUF3362 domain-containing protein [Vibrio lentus]|nr:DUF3362 domain-containing protein [Vibrio lentus]
MPKSDRQRRLHKALLRYHDQKTGRSSVKHALISMGKKHLIGDKSEHLVQKKIFFFFFFFF